MTMTQAELIVEMLNAAAPVIENYWTDLRHDAKLIAEAKPGDAFLWAPRSSGTYVVLLRRGEGGPNIRAAETFSAMSKISRGLQWHYMTIGQDCFIRPVNVDTALKSAEFATKNARERAVTGEGHVSEFHL